MQIDAGGQLPHLFLDGFLRRICKKAVTQRETAVDMRHEQISVDGGGNAEIVL